MCVENTHALTALPLMVSDSVKLAPDRDPYGSSSFDLCEVEARPFHSILSIFQRRCDGFGVAQERNASVSRCYQFFIRCNGFGQE